ncbi:META domain-containing protein [Corynebacterium sp.]|uniref:META domain-containing protein n=1 Tax=Corynebacterium sp. TaxID=1720 RepID=UPI003B3A5C25
MRARRTAVACAALALTLGLTACGDADDQDASPTTRTSEARTVTDTPADTPTDTPGDFSGTWVDPDGRGYLSFDGDGGITGSDACNGITTTYSVDGTTATVEPFPTTMMACGDGWSQWLLGVSTVELGDSSLTVRGQDGEELGTLVPGDVPE